MFPPHRRGGTSSGRPARAAASPSRRGTAAAGRPARTGRARPASAASSVQTSVCVSPSATPSRSFSVVFQPPASVIPQVPTRSSSTRTASVPPARAPRPRSAPSAHDRRPARARAARTARACRAGRWAARSAIPRSPSRTRPSRPDRPSAPAAGRARIGRAGFAARVEARAPPLDDPSARRVVGLHLRLGDRRAGQPSRRARRRPRPAGGASRRARAGAAEASPPRRSRASAGSRGCLVRRVDADLDPVEPVDRQATRVSAAAASVAKPALPGSPDPVADLERSIADPRMQSRPADDLRFVAGEDPVDVVLAEVETAAEAPQELDVFSTGTAARVPTASTAAGGRGSSRPPP